MLPVVLCVLLVLLTQVRLIVTIEPIVALIMAVMQAVKPIVDVMTQAFSIIKNLVNGIVRHAHSTVEPVANIVGKTVQVVVDLVEIVANFIFDLIGRLVDAEGVAEGVVNAAVEFMNWMRDRRLLVMVERPVLAVFRGFVVSVVPLGARPELRAVVGRLLGALDRVAVAFVQLLPEVIRQHLLLEVDVVCWGFADDPFLEVDLLLAVLQEYRGRDLSSHPARAVGLLGRC